MITSIISMYILSKSVKQSFDTKNEFCPLGHILSSSGTFLNMSARAFLPPLKCKNFSETGIGWLANSTKELWREVLNDGKVKFWARSKTACQSNWSCKKKIISTVYVTPPGYRPYPFHPIPPIAPQCYIHLRWRFIFCSHHIFPSHLSAIRLTSTTSRAAGTG